MMDIIKIIAGLLSGIIGGMGLGGGAVLLIYLKLFENLNQIKAQGINLLFFIPIAAVAISIYAFSHLIKWKTVLKMCLSGIPGCISAVMLRGALGGEKLGKIFAIILIILGISEIIKGFLLKRSGKRDNIKKE
ncbi:MAG: sulfite exporter TauE/SafE family protein [Clostridia bacterium]|nr:sulfite exporter TauE/SafE family protein [Clostridia bacterium]